MNWRKSSRCDNGNCAEVTWRKSSRCDNDLCVEVAHRTTEVLVRNNQLPDIHLSFDPDSWSKFMKEFRTQI